MSQVFLFYTRCQTCIKAVKWLEANNINVEYRDIINNNPNQRELSSWIRKSQKPIEKFFNTSGVVYKTLELKEFVKTASKDELLKILASDGILVKRPILVLDETVLIGFDEKEWEAALK